MSRANNYLTKSYSGIFGQQVTLEERGGKVIMTFPHARKKSKPSERQIDYRRKFQWASVCAKNILKDPEILKAYRCRTRRGQTAYNLALRDYLNGSIEGLTCLHDLPCFDTGAAHDLQKTDHCGQPEEREILFPVPGGRHVHDPQAPHFGYRRIRWSALFALLFQREPHIDRVGRNPERGGVIRI